MDRDRDIDRVYFEWLCGLVRADEPDHSYFCLAGCLHERSFVSIVPNDENRIAYGLELRSEFSDSDKKIERSLTGPCSVLEVLISVASSMADILWTPEEEDKTGECFWVLIDNLGLDRFDDEHYGMWNGREKIMTAIDTFLYRRYCKNGRGGIFPIQRTKKDMRKIELWEQMNMYIAQNYTY